MTRHEIGEAEAGVRFDKLLVSLLGVSRGHARRFLEAGRVLWIRSDGERRRGAKGDRPSTGDVLVVTAAAEELDDRARPDSDAPLSVAYATEACVVIEKPAGQPSAPLRPAEMGCSANALVARYPEMATVGYQPREPGLCHRLDTGTSGLLLAARSSAAFDTLTGALKRGELDKRYLLVCAADIADEGEIVAPIYHASADRVAVGDHPDARAAQTSFRVVRRHAELALVEARAARALRHQVRVHFASLGFPLLGDVLYGGATRPGLDRHALHASRIRWHGDEVVGAFDVTSELPRDMACLLALAGC